MTMELTDHLTTVTDPFISFYLKHSKDPKPEEAARYKAEADRRLKQPAIKTNSEN